MNYPQQQPPWQPQQQQPPQQYYQQPQQQQPQQQPAQPQEPLPQISGAWDVGPDEEFVTLPVGQHPASFGGLEPCSTAWGNKLRLKFPITAGQHAGQLATVLVGIPKGPLKPAHTLYKFACMMLGREPAVGERIDFNSFVGMPGYVVVMPTQGAAGRTKVSAFVPSAPQQQPQQAVQPQPMPPQQPVYSQQVSPQQTQQRVQSAWDDTQQQAKEVI